MSSCPMDGVAASVARQGLLKLELGTAHRKEHEHEKELIWMDVFVAAMIGFLSAIWFVLLAILILCIIANIYLFRKMGVPGWWGIIPFWNTYVLCEKTWTVNPWFWVCLGLVAAGWVFDGLVASVITLLAFAFTVALNLRTATAFGKGVGYCLGLTFLPVVFLPMLAFGTAVYQGNQTPPNQML